MHSCEIATMSFWSKRCVDGDRSLEGNLQQTITNFAPLLSTLGSMNEWMND